jgi:hypothetical protein
LSTQKPVCVGCGSVAPLTITNYTLISQKHGWRLILEEEEPGRRISKWWCPSCWAEQRKARQAAVKT